jgi:hypothetical protein
MSAMMRPNTIPEERSIGSRTLREDEVFSTFKDCPVEPVMAFHSILDHLAPYVARFILTELNATTWIVPWPLPGKNA